ncbi:MAG: BON domain-containing protein [Wenzhouxiangellaceae bacterium]|nr:BON domain-containing protein [Wenzhouxiangellaceae bacterium]
MKRFQITWLIAVFAVALGAGCVVDDDYYEDDLEQEIYEDVRQALSIHDEIDADELNIRVEGNDVYIDGVVSSHEQAALIHDVVHGVDGVDDVDVESLEVDY